MNYGYGLFNLSAQMIGVMVIISITLYLLTCVCYYKIKTVWGVVPHFIAIVLALICLLTMYTTVDWNTGKGGATIGMVFATAVVGICYLLPLNDVPSVRRK